MAARKRLVVLHLAGRYPLGGIGWQAVHYVLGLARLGHDVYYVEDSRAHPYDPRVKSVVEDSSYSVAFLADVMARFGLADRWAYVDGVTGTATGCPGSGSGPLPGGGRPPERLRRHAAQGRAPPVPGAHLRRDRSGLRADPGRRGRSPGHRGARRAHAPLHLRGEPGPARLPHPAGEVRLAHDPAARGPRPVGCHA